MRNSLIIQLRDSDRNLDYKHFLFLPFPFFLFPILSHSPSLSVKTNKSGFAPSVSQLIDGLHRPVEQDRLTEGEAWVLVKKAIADSGYNAKERFEELPPEVQRAVGGPEMLRQWGMTDSDEVNTVIMSNFQRTYKAVLAQKDYAERVPAAISDLVKSLADNLSSDRKLIRG